MDLLTGILCIFLFLFRVGEGGQPVRVWNNKQNIFVSLPEKISDLLSIIIITISQCIKKYSVREELLQLLYEYNANNPAVGTELEFDATGPSAGNVSQIFTDSDNVLESTIDSENSSSQNVDDSEIQLILSTEQKEASLQSEENENNSNCKMTDGVKSEEKPGTESKQWVNSFVSWIGKISVIAQILLQSLDCTDKINSLPGWKMNLINFWEFLADYLSDSVRQSQFESQN